MLQAIYRKLRQGMQSIIEHLTEDLGSVRTGRASAGLVEGIMVEHYGSKMMIKQVATITIPDAASIAIQPWDKSTLSAIETAIRNSDIGMSPVNDGNNIRLQIPPMTAERRNEMVDMVNAKAESAKVALRGVRKDAWEEVQTLEKNKQATEDDRYAAEKELNKIIEEFNGKVDAVAESKKKEITAI